MPRWSISLSKKPLSSQLLSENWLLDPFWPCLTDLMIVEWSFSKVVWKCWWDLLEKDLSRACVKLPNALLELASRQILRWLSRVNGKLFWNLNNFYFAFQDPWKFQSSSRSWCTSNALLFKTTKLCAVLPTWPRLMKSIDEEFSKKRYIFDKKMKWLSIDFSTCTKSRATWWKSTGSFDKQPPSSCATCACILKLSSGSKMRNTIDSR